MQINIDPRAIAIGAFGVDLVNDAMEKCGRLADVVMHPSESNKGEQDIVIAELNDELKTEYRLHVALVTYLPKAFPNADGNFIGACFQIFEAIREAFWLHVRQEYPEIANANIGLRDWKVVKRVPVAGVRAKRETPDVDVIGVDQFMQLLGGKKGILN